MSWDGAPTDSQGGDMEVIGAVLFLVVVAAVAYLAVSLRRSNQGSAFGAMVAMSRASAIEALARSERDREISRREWDRERLLRERERDMARRERELELETREYEVESAGIVLAAAREADRAIEEARRRAATRRHSTFQASTAGSTLVH